MTTGASPRRAALVLLLGANLLWGSIWVVAKLALGAFSPVQLGAWRAMVAGVAVVPWLILRLRRDPLPARAWMAVALLGLAGFVVAKLLNYWGLSLTTATDASLLMATEPLFTIALGRVVLGEALGGRRLAGFALGAAGAWLLISGGWRLPDPSAAHVLGDLLFMAGLFCEAVYSVFGKALLTRHSAAVVTVATIVMAGVMWAPLAVADGLRHGWPAPTLGAMAAIAFLALGCTVAGYWAWFAALERMDAAAAAQTIFVQPLWGTLLAVTLLGERLGTAQVTGGALVLLSLLVALGGRPRD